MARGSEFDRLESYERIIIINEQNIDVRLRKSKTVSYPNFGTPNIVINIVRMSCKSTTTTKIEEA